MKGARRERQKTEKTIEIDLHKLIGAILIVAMSILLIIALVGFVRSLMRVSVFDVLGDSPYEREEIISACGIRPKDKLYEIDAEGAAEKIMASCPYIHKVEIKSRFPNRVEIRVESLSPSWYIEIADDYYALDSSLRVLEETSDNRKFINGGVPKLALPNIKLTEVGETLIYGNTDTEIKYAERFMATLKQSSFKSRLTLVDIENRIEVYIQVDGVIDVYMGSSTDAEAKLKAVEKALSDPRLENCISAEVDVSNPSAVYIKPVYDYGSVVPEEGGEGSEESVG